MFMKQGEEVDCVHCGKSTFVVKKSVMDGWTKIGDVFACSLCDAKLADVEYEEVEREKKISQASSALAGFLDTEPEEKVTLVAEGSEAHFCRDCDNLIVHPFLIRCELYDKDVDPMGDCPDFIKRDKRDIEKKEL